MYTKYTACIFKVTEWNHLIETLYVDKHDNVTALCMLYDCHGLSSELIFSKTQLSIFSFKVNILRWVMLYEKICNCVLNYYETLSPIIDHDNHKTRTVLLHLVVCPHTKFQVISFRNFKITQDILIYKFAMYILRRQMFYFNT